MILLFLGIWIGITACSIVVAIEMHRDTNKILDEMSVQEFEQYMSLPEELR